MTAPTAPARLSRSLLSRQFLAGVAITVLAASLVSQEAETAATSAPRSLAEMVDSITVDEIEEHVGFFASPELAGRGTGSPGFDQAAEYVEQELERLGLVPAGDDGGWRLRYSLESLVADECSFALSTGPNQGQAWEAGKDFVPLIGSAETELAGQAVFAGFAIDSRKDRWQDLSPKKVRNKIVFAFTREPFAGNARTKRFDGAEATSYSLISTKAKAVAQAGGLALVVVPDPGGYPVASEPLTSVVPVPLGRGMSLERIRSRTFADIPVLSVSRGVADQVFGTDTAAYWASMEKAKKPKLLEPGQEGTLVELRVEWATKEVDYYNLAARLSGSDQDGEVVILGAHLDHVGQNYTAAEMWRMGTVATHPGADDNASGCSALLEVAEAMATTRPKEDILFLWFSGEELGLLGSKAYCEEPVYPHDKTILMLNMDQIGRTSPKEFSLGGLWDRPKWERLVKKAHKGAKIRIKMDTKSGRDMFERSDQFSFFQKDVPALFFFEGDINDNLVYHQPGDVAATLKGDKSCAVAQVFLAVCHAVAYEGKRP